METIFKNYSFTYEIVIITFITGLSALLLIFRLYSKLVGKKHEIAILDRELAHLTDVVSQLSEIKKQLVLANTTKENYSKRVQELEMLLVRSESELESWKNKFEFFSETQTILENNFKNLANQIFDEKSRSFREINSSQLESLLKPYKERLIEFESSLGSMYQKASSDKLLLSQEIHGLKELNLRMNEEARKLSQALSHEAKVKGNWGELVLEKILESSGLRPGKDFKREVVFKTSNGTKRPDVIIYLPKGKHIVVDAKVSLNSYARFVNSETKNDKDHALKELTHTINSRIKELSDREYFVLPGLKSPELVLLFLPNEGAFIEVFRDDETIVQRSMESNVLVTGPSTFLASLNIIRQVWNFEEHNTRTIELMEKARKMHQKCLSFLGSMEDIGKHLDKAKRAHGKAFGQLSEGKGNLLSQLDEMGQLGVSSKKISFKPAIGSQNIETNDD